MTPANDNIDRTRHAGTVLRHVLKGCPDARVLMDAGLTYVRASDTTAMDQTLAIAGADVVAVAKRILREGQDLTTAGRALGGYATDVQARAWAKGKLEAALNMLTWHPQRIEHETYTQRLLDRIADLKARLAVKIAVGAR